MTDVNTLITDHLDIWTSAIAKKSGAGRGNGGSTSLHGLKKLRELIFELAVRGRLVDHDESEGRASDLVAELKHQKDLLFKQGKIRKPKLYSKLLSEDVPYETPGNWAQERLGALATKITDGSHNPPKNVGSGLPMLSSQNVRNGVIDFENPSRFVTHEDFLTENKRTDVAPGDVLLTIVASLGRSAVVPKSAPDFVLQRSVAVIRTGLVPSFLALVFQSPLCINYFWKHAKGTAQKGIYLGKLAEMPILVPPTAEQRRIVAKVDKLMTLCDALEQQTEDSLVAHRTLVGTLLGTLVNSHSPKKLTENWARVLEHFDTLFTTEESIDELKRTINELAVMGRLTGPVQEDEPANDLLEQIAVHRLSEVTAGNIRKEKPLVNIDDDVAYPFSIPDSWLWAKVGQIALFAQYGTSTKADESLSGIPVLAMGNIQSGEVIGNSSKKLPLDSEEFPDLYLKKEDLLYNRTNSAELVGKTGIYRGEDDSATFASYLIRIRVPRELVSAEYVNIAMNAPYFRETQIIPHIRKQTGQANVNGTIMRNMLIPLPPLTEQYRIVSQVKHLLQLCDQIREKIAEVSEIEKKLADTAVNEVAA